MAEFRLSAQPEKLWLLPQPGAPLAAAGARLGYKPQGTLRQASASAAKLSPSSFEMRQQSFTGSCVNEQTSSNGRCCLKVMGEKLVMNLWLGVGVGEQGPNTKLLKA